MCVLLSLVMMHNDEFTSVESFMLSDSSHEQEALQEHRPPQCLI